MPYIPVAERLLPAEARHVNVGNLTYELQQAINRYLLIKLRTDPDGLMRYQYLSEAKAALHGCLDDFQARVVAPYEVRKVIENGEVWDHQLLKSVGASGYPYVPRDPAEAP